MVTKMETYWKNVIARNERLIRFCDFLSLQSFAVIPYENDIINEKATKSYAYIVKFHNHFCA